MGAGGAAFIGAGTAALAIAALALAALALAALVVPFLGVSAATTRILDFFAGAASAELRGAAAATTSVTTLSAFRLKMNHRFKYENCWTASFIL